MRNVTELTQATFREFVRVSRFAAVQFWAAWNGYDREMTAILRSQIPSDLARLIALATFDTEPAENHQIVREHGVLNLPFLALYRDGSLTHAVTGMRKPDEIVACLRGLVSGDGFRGVS